MPVPDSPGNGGYLGPAAAAATPPVRSTRNNPGQLYDCTAPRSDPTVLLRFLAVAVSATGHIKPDGRFENSPNPLNLTSRIIQELGTRE